MAEPMPGGGRVSYGIARAGGGKLRVQAHRSGLVEQCGRINGGIEVGDDDLTGMGIQRHLRRQGSGKMGLFFGPERIGEQTVRQEQISMIAPTIPTVKRLLPISPPLLASTLLALKKTPLPMTIPTTIEMAVKRP